MLQNAYFLAKIGADTAENEQHFAEILQKKLATTLAASRSASRCARVASAIVSHCCPASGPSPVMTERGWNLY